MELAELSALVTEGQKLKQLLTETPEILTFLQLTHDTGERLRTQKTAWQVVSGSLLLAVIF